MQKPPKDEPCFISIPDSEHIADSVSCDQKYHHLFFVENSPTTVLKGAACDRTTIFNQTVCYELNTSKHLSVQNFTSIERQFEIMFNGPFQFQNSSSIENVVIISNGTAWYAARSSEYPIPSYSILAPRGKPRFTFKNANSVVYLTCQNCKLWIDETGWGGLTCFTDAYNNYIQRVPDVVKISSTTFKFTLHAEYGLANYWCVGHSVFDMQPIETESRAFGQMPLNVKELAFFLWMDLNETNRMEELAITVKMKLVPKYAIYVRAFEVIMYLEEGRVLFHAGVKSSIDEFKIALETIFNDGFHGHVNSSEICHTQPLEKDPSVYWKEAKINQNSSLSSRNHTINGKHPRRKCLGNFLYGGVWQTFDESLIIKSDDISSTFDLEEILENINSTNPLETVDALNTVTQASEGNLDPSNYEKIGQILGNVSQNLDKVEEGSEPEMIQGIASICDTLMKVPCEDCGNSTNNIVANIEQTIDHLIVCEDIESDYAGLSFVLKSNFTVISIDPSKKNISGLKFYKKLIPGAMNDGEIFYNYIFMNTTLEEFSRFSLEDSLSLATFFPEDLLEHLSRQNIETPLRIVLKVYRNDNLFQEDKGFQNSSKIVEFNVTSISVPYYTTEQFPTNLPFTFEYEGLLPECKYWNYRNRSWGEGGIYFGGNTDSHLTCYIEHLTSFTSLVDIRDLSNSMNNFWLDVITMTCSTLSLIGLLGIFLSAIFLSKWRKKRSTQVLLQLCLATFVQTMIFFFTSTENFRGKHGLVICITFGSFLQYTLLVQFMWMLAIGYSNWMMYIRPFKYASDGASANGFIVSAICWGVPLIPVIAIIIFGLVDSYVDSNLSYDLCFPSNKSKLWGFIIPIYSILFINFVFYILLIIGFWKMQRNRTLLQIKTDLQLLIRNLTILFFALGIPWIFGLLHIAISGSFYPNVFSYLFVLTAPLQGFILCMYFVVLNPIVGREWTAYIQSIRYNDDEELGVASTFLKILMHPKWLNKRNYTE